MKTPFDKEEPKTQEQLKAEAEKKYGRKMDTFENMLSNDPRLKDALVVLGAIHNAQGGDYAFEAMLGNKEGEVQAFKISVSKVEN